MDIKDFCRAVADGETIQIRQCAGWLNATLEDGLDRMCGNPAQVRIAPALTSVDMSVLVGSGIDMQFCDGENGWRPWSSLLSKIEGNLYHPQHSATGEFCYSRCRPRMDYWHSSSNFVANIVGGRILQLERAGFAIENDHHHSCIKFTGLLDGYCWPWQADQ